MSAIRIDVDPSQIIRWSLQSRRQQQLETLKQEMQEAQLVRHASKHAPRLTAREPVIFNLRNLAPKML
jgi:hypothetical protein